jgi:hypothetical protein
MTLGACLRDAAFRRADVECTRLQKAATSVVRDGLAAVRVDVPKFNSRPIRCRCYHGSPCSGRR